MLAQMYFDTYLVMCRQWWHGAIAKLRFQQIAAESNELIT